MGNNYKRSNEAETNSKNKNVRDIYRDISAFKNAWERRKELSKLGKEDIASTNVFWVYKEFNCFRNSGIGSTYS